LRSISKISFPCQPRPVFFYGERIKNRSFPKGAPGSVFNTFEVL
jgi:hypothetical protein